MPAPGTVLSCMMSLIALRMREMISLRQGLTRRRIAVFVVVVASGSLGTGLPFNVVDLGRV